MPECVSSNASTRLRLFVIHARIRATLHRRFDVNRTPDFGGHRSGRIDRRLIAVHGVACDAVGEDTSDGRDPVFLLTFLLDRRALQSQAFVICAHDVRACECDRPRVSVSSGRLDFRDLAFSFRCVRHDDEAVHDDVSDRLDRDDVADVILLGITAGDVPLHPPEWEAAGPNGRAFVREPLKMSSP